MGFPAGRKFVCIFIVHSYTSTPIIKFVRLEQCSHIADFFQRDGALLEQGQIIFGDISKHSLRKFDKFFGNMTFGILDC